MLLLVYRQLIHSPGRSVQVLLAMAAVVAAILILEGFEEGLVTQLARSVMNRGADLVVTQAGVSNMIAARSVLPQNARAVVEAVEGVTAAYPMAGLPLIYRQGDERTPIFLIVYQELGGPRELISGGPPSGAREIAIDRALADKYGLGVGDPLVVSGYEFRVSGITAGAAAFFTAFAFARFDALLDFYFESDVAADLASFPLVSFLLVELAPGAEPESVAARIEADLPAGDVFTAGQLAGEDAAFGRVMFGPIFGMLVTVAYVLGVLVTAMITFALVHARRRELGVLKALGFPPGGLAASVVTAAGAFLLVILFQAVYAGESEQVVGYLRHARADVWVMQRGVSNMHMATSLMPDSRMARIEALPGAASSRRRPFTRTTCSRGCAWPSTTPRAPACWPAPSWTGGTARCWALWKVAGGWAATGGSNLRRGCS